MGESAAVDYAPSASDGEFLSRIDAVLPMIKARAAETETLGRASDEVTSALIEAGMFRSLTPQQYGGLEVHPATWCEATYRVASSCASSGWFAGLVSVHNWQIAHLSKKMQDEYFAEGPDARASSSYAPTGKVESTEGGFNISGRWDFSSGVDHCKWAILGAVIKDIDEPEFRSFVVPSSDFRIVPDSWQVTGLRGTGSKSVVIEGAFVPEHRTHRVVDVLAGTEPGMQHNDRPLYRIPWMSIFWYAIGATAIGAARGGVDAFLDINRERVSPASGRPAAANPFLWTRLAEADHTVDLHHERMLSNWVRMYDQVCSEPAVERTLSRASRFDSSKAVLDCFHALGHVYEIAGGGVIHNTNPVQRFYRDLMAMVNHPAGNLEGMAMIYSKQLLGIPPDEFDKASMGALMEQT